MAALADLCRFNPVAGSTTDFVYSSTVAGCQSPSQANVQNGVAYKCLAISADLTQWELFQGVYTSASGTFARTTVLYNSSGTGTASPGQSGAGTKINFTLAPQVAVVGLAEDIATPAILQGYISGLTLSTAGSSTTFAVAAGVAVDSTNANFMSLASSISKTTGAFAAGSGNGALDTGTIAASTWYHAFLIQNPTNATTDVLVSLSPSGPTLPTGYTLFRRIGSMLTDGSKNWTAFVQVGNDFIWATPIIEPNINGLTVTTTVAAKVLSRVPTGVRTVATLLVATTATVASAIVISSTDSSVAGGSIPAGYSLLGASPGGNAGQCQVETDTSAQINVVSSAASMALSANVQRYTDTRGAASVFAGAQPSINIAALLQGYISGLTLSTAGASTTFSVATGVAVDSTNAGVMTLAASLNKTTSAWAAGTGNGALDTGAIAASTWYHAFLISNASGAPVDVLVSLSASAPTMPSGYTLFRRIGSMKTNGSSQWTKFSQLGNEFLWDVPVLDVNQAAIGTVAVTPTLSTPLGVQTGALLFADVFNATNVALLLSSLDITDTSPNRTTGLGTIWNSSNSNISEQVGPIRTSTASQIRARADLGTTTYSLWTYGWIDTRGAPSYSAPIYLKVNDELLNISFAVSAAAGALTIALKDGNGNDPSISPIGMTFKNVSLTASPNTPTPLTIGASSSIVLPSTSTLGIPSATACRVWITGWNDGGTFRLGVFRASNVASGIAQNFPLLESGVASSSLVGVGSTSAGVHYTAGAAVTNKRYRVLGYIEWNATGMTAGTWTTTNLSDVEIFGRGTPLPGQEIQRAFKVVATGDNTTTLMTASTSLPQNTGGKEFMNQAITPQSAANILEIEMNAVLLSDSSSINCIQAMFQDSVANALAANWGWAATGNRAMSMQPLRYTMVSQTVVSTTFRYRAGPESADTLRFNQNSSVATLFPNVADSYILIKELMG